MKLVQKDNKLFARHWFRWYIFQDDKFMHLTLEPLLGSGLKYTMKFEKTARTQRAGKMIKT